MTTAPLANATAIAADTTVTTNIPAVTTQPTNAYFVGADGSLYGYGRTIDGTWPNAVPVGAKISAPIGAPVASARLSDGTPAAFTIGNDGALYGGCGGWLWRLTPTSLLKAATPLAVALTSTTTMVLLPDHQGHLTGVHIESEIHHPCGSPVDSPPPPPTEALPGSWYTTNTMAAAIGLPNGKIGVFTVDVNGIVHAAWRDTNGRWTDSQLTAAGASHPGGGIAVTSSADGSALSLFYSNHTGQVVLAHVIAGGGLTSAPEPSPWAVPNIPDGAPLGAASSTLGNDVAYAATGGAVVDLQVDAAGNWQNAVPLSTAQFARDGAPIAVTAGTNEVDVYCGTLSGAPGHFGVPPHTGGNVVWRAAGASGLLPTPGGITAS